jgi:hypothetical protein
MNDCGVVICPSSRRQIKLFHTTPSPQIGELNALLNGIDLQVLAVSETCSWFNSRVNLSGFCVVRVDRGGDGVTLYLKEDLRYTVVAWSTPTSVEDCLFVKSRLLYPILICAIYNSPNING